MTLRNKIQHYLLALGLGLALSYAVVKAIKKRSPRKATPSQVLSEDYDKGLWVFTDEISKKKAREQLITYSRENGVDTLYLSVYRSTPNKKKRLMHEEKNLTDLLQKAHKEGIDVWAAYGAPDWATASCTYQSFPLQRMLDIKKFNRDNPNTTFKGVMLDIEPEERERFQKTPQIL